MAEIRTAAPRHRNELGGVGECVRRNLRAVRSARGVSTAELSRRLGELGRPLQPTAITKIEAGDRRVDVDDVTALALALRVSTTRLMLPVDEAEEIALAPEVVVPGGKAWTWAFGDEPLDGEDLLPRYSSRNAAIYDFRRHSLPEARILREQEPAPRAARELLDSLRFYQMMREIDPNNPNHTIIGNVEDLWDAAQSVVLAAIRRLLAEVGDLLGLSLEFETQEAAREELTNALMKALEGRPDLKKAVSTGRPTLDWLRAALAAQQEAGHASGAAQNTPVPPVDDRVNGEIRGG